MRTDTLYNEINLVFEKFLGPFLQLFRQTAALLTQPQPDQTKEQYALLAQCMVLLLDIYYDFTCHDLPPAIEDSHMEFFGANGGWFPLLMSWDPVQLRGDVDNTTPSLYVFQLAQMLELHPSNVPDSYCTLLPFLLAQAMWQQKGSIPGLVKLLRAYLA